MPTHSLLQCVESPDGHPQDALISGAGGLPEPGSSMTPHSSGSEKAAGGGGAALSCMFCDRTFARQDELGPHVLTQHPTTFYEPAVLRVEAEFRIPGERPRAKASGLPVAKEEVHSCIVCGQVSQDAGELEAHMRKHKDYFTFCCSVCGRRFREPWFLKTHMRMHAKAGSKNRAQQDQETPATVNGVVREPPESVVTLYKMCMVCGFFFPDHEALVEHSKVHNRELEPGKDEGSSLTQETFLHSLGLLQQPHGQPERASKWIPQLDPFNTYQAWQMATRGKIAVGPNTSKDTSQEASTDNEEGSSDKDEASNGWAEGQGDKGPREVLARDLRSQQQQPAAAEGPGTRRRCLMQKVKEKERPTSCEDCQRTFRTYHQLVLHSRIHKRERSGEESPTSAERKSRLEQAEEGSEEGLEDPMSENLGPGEDGFAQTKARSRECNYCGKSFRSSYYLTIHLRTHTGEKPYKCVHCDYAAAQKTSLKYHLDRHHKDKRCAEIPNRPLASPVDGKPGEDVETPAESSARPPAPAARSSGGSEDSCETVDDKPGSPLLQINAERQEFIPASTPSLTDGEVNCPILVNLKTDEIREGSDIPLNLSLKVSFSIAPSAEARSALVPVACQLCTYKTFYPEVLTMHRQLVHKDKPQKKNRFGGPKHKRLTGCPPALEGRDVGPLPAFGRRHPRRTKSPLRPPANPKEKPPAHPPPPPKSPPARAPARDVQESQPQRRNSDGAPRQQPPRYADASRKSFSGSKSFPGPPDHVPVGERGYPGRGGVIWHSDAARLCLSSQFGPFPPIDFGEPSSKRLKYAAAPCREADPGVFLGPVGAASSRLLIPGRGGKSAPAPPCPTPDGLGPSMSAAAMGGGLDGDWSMMNLLSSYSANDLASLYHSTPPPPAHAGLANPRAGGITVLYQHLPTLPTLQRRDPAALFPSQRYGAADKTT